MKAKEEALYKISVMISPFMPTTATKMAKQLGLDIDFDKLQLSNVLEWGAYPVGNVLNNAEPIFPRVEFIEEESKVEYNENLQIDNPISIDYFNKIKKIIECFIYLAFLCKYMTCLLK